MTELSFSDAIEYAVMNSGDPSLLGDLRSLLDERDAVLRDISESGTLANLNTLLCEQEQQLGLRLSNLQELTQMEAEQISESVVAMAQKLRSDFAELQEAGERLACSSESSGCQDFESDGSSDARTDAPGIAALREISPQMTQLVQAARETASSTREALRMHERSVQSYRHMVFRKRIVFRGIDILWDLAIPLAFFVLGLPTVFLSPLLGAAASLALLFVSWALGRWVVRPRLDASLLARRKHDMSAATDAIYVRLVCLRCSAALSRSALLPSEG